MKISKQSRRDAKHLFKACQVNGRMDEGRVRETVKLVIDRQPRGYVGTLVHFQRLVKLDIDKRTAHVESATELAPDTQAGVKANLAKVYGDNIALSFSVNPKLIGGLRIKVGSDVLDGSIQARLNNLQNSFR
jgi:F-type H+-transporting ATPase subunit delta